MKKKNWNADDFDHFEDFEDSDDFDEEDIDEDIFDESDPDINDLPALLQLLQEQGAIEAIEDVKSTLRDEMDREAEGEDREVEIHTVFETSKHAKYPGFSRSLLSVHHGNVTLGSILCQSLVRELNEHYEDLLFGLTDNIYLHATRSYTICNGHACASTRFYWSEEESPHPLIIRNVADIVENEKLVYLIIGDLVEDLVNRIENSQTGTNGKEVKKNGV